jgi:Bacterial conjugation TrbI-like protein
MKTVSIVIFLCGLVVGIATAQDSAARPSASPPSEPQTLSPAQPPAQAAAPQSSTPAQPTRIAAGSVIPVSLTKTIDAKKAKTGDEVIAKVTEDIKTSSGEVLVPKDTKVVGRVTEVQPRNKEQKESAIGIAFDRAVMKNGSEMQMPMSIQAIIGPQNDQNSGNGSPTGVPNAGTGANPNPSRAGGMGGSAQSPTPSTPSVGSNAPSDTQTGTNARPRITAQTEGVVGISDVKLTPAVPANRGSLVSSEKNNVKLESGTFMLLRVNP